MDGILQPDAPTTPGAQVWKRNEVQSPCINICVVHPEARLCTGCLRSIDEITRWSKMDTAERARIMDDLPGRKGQLTKRRGGRAARLARGL
ncbi:DUF1289 domain-containing protein [Rhodobacteraceae bacterium KMM 6894]|nr:DUF1289 domain-containing protein [Rhodobacteraceae bacterium KMM 6894]